MTPKVTSIFSGFNSGAKNLTDSDSNYDYKSILLWLTVAIFVVFGAVKILKVLLKRSERRSEEWRQSSHLQQQQQVDLLPQKNDNENEFSTNTKDATEKTEIIERVA